MTRRPAGLHLAILALLASLAYAPALFLPLMEDDFPNLSYAVAHGSPAAAAALFHDPIFRVRATSAWLMYGLWKAFGLAPAAFHSASLLLHVANCWLLYGILRSLTVAAPLRAATTRALASVRERLPFFAASFFAVYEGHQEAVMWFSAMNEMLLFCFGAASLLLWLHAEGRISWELASLLAFALALVSKESAVIWLPLFLVARPRSGMRLAPHAVLAALAIAAVWSTRAFSFRFSDGSFSLAAPFWITWPRGCARVLWPWGWLALAAIAWLRNARLWRPAAAALAWIGIALVPYSFLTYSTQIPSRQTYLASAGLALLIGLALAHLSVLPDIGRKLAAAAAASILVVNVGYLWTKKRAQFLERAEPTERLIRLARQTSGPIFVACFPRNRYIAEEAVRMGAGKSPDTLVWSEAEAAQRGAARFCYGTPPARPAALPR
ncbi:MAG TPA: hypothetical protein VLW65_03210 [Bryobacteraceae bacterium]|nr:hypothetical protein [Bryobacteraceae bacterium]